MVRRWFSFCLFFSPSDSILFGNKKPIDFPHRVYFSIFFCPPVQLRRVSERAAVGQLAPAKVKSPQGGILSDFVVVCKLQADGNLFICKVHKLDKFVVMFFHSSLLLRLSLSLRSVLSEQR